MKKILIICLLLLLSFVLLFPFTRLLSQNDSDYLKEVLEFLESTGSFIYSSKASYSAPGDTSMFSTESYFKCEVVNEVDTQVRAKFYFSDINDTSKVKYCYDGQVSARIDRGDNTVWVDDFQDNHHPYKLVMPPFFATSKEIIRYALYSNEPKSVNYTDFGDSLKVTLKIYDQVVEFISAPISINHPTKSSKGKISQYEVWINRTTRLPYKIRRKMHQISVEECSNVKYNHQSDLEIYAANYFPPNFTIKDKHERKFDTEDMKNKKAPDWILESVDREKVALNDLKRKVILIHFTGVGCGACHASIPFLNSLVADYGNKDFELVSVEGFSTNMEVLKSYRDKNALNYKLLVSTKELTQSYKVLAVPVFFILDENKIIQDVYLGYKEGETDREIKESINKLL